MSWKVPEQFRLDNIDLSLPGDPYGGFKCPSPARQGFELLIMASPGGPLGIFDGKERVVTWEHVSVHAWYTLTGRDSNNATPTWDEMDYVKSLFWDDADVVMQLHVNDGRKVNIHNHTLHLWRPTDWEIKLPDADLI